MISSVKVLGAAWANVWSKSVSRVGWEGFLQTSYQEIRLNSNKKKKTEKVVGVVSVFIVGFFFILVRQVPSSDPKCFLVLTSRQKSGVKLLGRVIAMSHLSLCSNIDILYDTPQEFIPLFFFDRGVLFTVSDGPSWV